MNKKAQRMPDFTSPIFAIIMYLISLVVLWIISPLLSEAFQNALNTMQGSEGFLTTFFLLIGVPAIWIIWIIVGGLWIYYTVRSSNAE